jgi:hypothetical protein
MEYGICNLSVIPMRREPKETSEMISQVLFGETFELMEWGDKWVKIITTSDKYTGWINRLQFTLLGHIGYNQLFCDPAPLTHGAITQAWKLSDNTTLYLPIASSLAFYEGNRCKIENEKFEIIGPKGYIDSFANTAKSFLDAPYLWGGRTHFGIDCSGFTQAVFKLQGININRDASAQAEQGKIVDSLQKARLGDLAFFENAQGKITHVGILLNSTQIIHASGKVKIDDMDADGIYSLQLKRTTHKLCLIKRYF